MNLPTKITISRIAIVILLILTLLGLTIAGICGYTTPYIVINVNGTINNINIVYIVVFCVFVIASATDWLDGHLARKNNQVTDLGKFLDPIADKLLVNSMIIFLAAYSSFAIGQMRFPVFCAIFLIARDIVVDGLRLIAAKKNVVIAANIYGKFKTVLEMVAIGVILLNGWPFTYFDAGWNDYLRIGSFLAYIATAVSLLSGVIYVVQNRKVLTGDKHE